MPQTENTHGRTRLSFASVADIDEFVTTLERYERGELTPDQWRAFRLVRGTYGQRQAADAQMLRVKIPQGVVDPAVAPAAGLSAQAFTTPGGTSVSSFILTPTPLTAENLQLAIDGGQITKEELCKGVEAAKAPPACK